MDSNTTPPEPAPPRMLDLGNGEAFAGGTADELRAAADWLERNYPDDGQGERYGPWQGPLLNMGYELRRMVRDGAPGDWTPLMRLIAGEIADDARDPGETGLETVNEWPWSAIPIEGEYRHGKWRPGLAEICGVTPRAISDALTRLARTGYEMRTPITDKDGNPVRDKRGRPMFAARGHALRFRVPPLDPRDEPQSSHESATYDRERSHSDVSKVAPQCDPIPSASPHENQSPHAVVSVARAEVEGGYGGEPDFEKLAQDASCVEDAPLENFEDLRRRELDRIEAWMREHQETTDHATS